LISIPFTYPAEMLADVASGAVVRYGSLLKDAVTGKIVAHMQEGSVAQSLLSLAGSGIPNPVSMAADVFNAGTNVYTAVQVSKLRAMMETLQALQVATLGVSLVGLGVSVAGFAYMHKRFNSLDERIDQIIDVINIGFANQHKAALRGGISRARGILQRASHAHELANPGPEYSRVAASLAEHAAYFEGELAFLGSEARDINHELYWQISQFLILCNSVRIDCELRNNELRHATVVAEEIAGEYRRLFDTLSPSSFDAPVDKSSRLVQILRDATDAAATKPYLIDYIRVAGFKGPEYLTSLESEKEEPILLLREA
jgi:hypothetical protein